MMTVPVWKRSKKADLKELYSLAKSTHGELLKLNEKDGPPPLSFDQFRATDADAALLKKYKEVCDNFVAKATEISGRMDSAYRSDLEIIMENMDGRYLNAINSLPKEKQDALLDIEKTRDLEARLSNLQGFKRNERKKLFFVAVNYGEMYLSSEVAFWLIKYELRNNVGPRK